MPDITNSATKTTLNAKMNEVKAEIPNINSLAATITLTTVENKISDISNLVKKADYDTKVNEIEEKITDHSHGKYITTPEFNRLIAENFEAWLAQANLVTKTYFDEKLKNLNKKVNSNKTKHVIVENGLKILETFDPIYFRGKSHFEDDGNQNYLVVQTAYRYFKTVSINDSNILSRKSKGLSDENINPPSTSNKTLNLSVNMLALRKE